MVREGRFHYRVEDRESCLNWILHIPINKKGRDGIGDYSSIHIQAYGRNKKTSRNFWEKILGLKVRLQLRGEIIKEEYKVFSLGNYKNGDITRVNREAMK